MADTDILDLINNDAKKKLLEIKIHQSTNCIKQPVGIIGTGSPSDNEYIIAISLPISITFFRNTIINL